MVIYLPHSPSIYLSLLSKHVYFIFFPDSEGLPIGKLDLRQRLLIALGAAKGKCNS